MMPVEFEEFDILTLVSCGEKESNSLLILGIRLIVLMGHKGLSYSVVVQPGDLKRTRKILRNVDTSRITPSERHSID
jgi:hypothetical protein